MEHSRASGSVSLIQRLNLRSLLFFMVGVPVALLSALLTLGVIGIAERALEERLQGEIDLIARAIEPLVSGRLERGDVAGVAESMDAVFSIGRVYGAAVYDRDGELVARSGHADRDLGGSEFASATVASGERAGGYRELGQAAVYSAFTPLYDRGGRSLGLLQVNRSRSEMRSAIERLRRQSWWLWSGIVVLVTLGLAFTYRRFVEQPVSALLRGMDAVSSGARETRLEVPGPREFRRLSMTVNEMLDALAEADAARETYRLREISLLQELSEAERTAEIGRMATGIAHELGAPLTVISRRAQRSLDAAGENADRRGLERIVTECDRLGSIVHQLLDYSRPGNERRRLLSPLATARTAMQSVQEQAEEQSIRLLLDTAPDASLPELRADPVRLEMALNNLLRNAIRHAVREVRVEVRRGTGAVEYRISDDGPGIDPEDEARLYEPFFTREDTGAGTGLGLPIVERIALEHGGSIEHAPGSEGGAVFILRLPAEESTA
jgi:signal transduction histidine kinase